RRHTRFSRDWSSDVCSSDLGDDGAGQGFVVEGPEILQRTATTGQQQDVVAATAPGLLEHGADLGGGAFALDRYRQHVHLQQGEEIGRASCRETEDVLGARVM